MQGLPQNWHALLLEALQRHMQHLDLNIGLKPKMTDSHLFLALRVLFKLLSSVLLGHA
jgi:hypothetical protein